MTQRQWVVSSVTHCPATDLAQIYIAAEGTNSGQLSSHH